MGDFGLTMTDYQQMNMMADTYDSKSQAGHGMMFWTGVFEAMHLMT